MEWLIYWWRWSSKFELADKLHDLADKPQELADKLHDLADKSQELADKPLKLADKTYEVAFHNRY